MSIAEILLLILGAVIFAAGFIVPDTKGKEGEAPDISNAQEELKRTADECVADAKRKITETVMSECAIAQDDAARAMEKLSNEKIMAINEYGKTVVDEIERNHKEVLFLYDMLNEKSADIKNTVRKVDSVNKEVREKEKEKEPETVQKIQGFQAVKDRPALKAALKAGGVGRNGTAAVTRHENAMRDERRAAYGVSGVSNENETHENKDRAFKIPRMFAPGGASGSKTQEEHDENSYAQEDLNGRIMGLHNDGVSDVDIARELGIGVGEVRLKIGLMEAKQG